MGWTGELRAAAALALLIAASARADGPTPAARPADPPLSAQDLKLLEDLELLEQLDLLRDWDPEEALPIPAAAPREREEDEQ